VKNEICGNRGIKDERRIGFVHPRDGIFAQFLINERISILEFSETKGIKLVRADILIDFGRIGLDKLNPIIEILKMRNSVVFIARINGFMPNEEENDEGQNPENALNENQEGIIPGNGRADGHKTLRRTNLGRAQGAKGSQHINRTGPKEREQGKITDLKEKE
jgi:hypothetical protein